MTPEDPAAVAEPEEADPNAWKQIPFNEGGMGSCPYAGCGVWLEWSWSEDLYRRLKAAGAPDTMLLARRLELGMVAGIPGQNISIVTCPKCEKKSVYRKALDPRTLREMEARKIDDGPKASAPLRVTYAWQLVSMERFLQELVSERNRFTRAKIANRLATVGIYLPLSWATPPGTPARESGDR